MLAHKNSFAEVLTMRNRHAIQQDDRGDPEEVPDLFPPSADYQAGRPSEETQSSPATPSSSATDYMAKMMESQLDAWSSLRSAGFVTAVRWSMQSEAQDADDSQCLNTELKESLAVNRGSLRYDDTRHSVSSTIHALSPDVTAIATSEPVASFSELTRSHSQESLKEMHDSSYSLSAPSSRPETSMTNHTSDSFTTCTESNLSPKELVFHSSPSSPLRDCFTIDALDISYGEEKSQPPVQASMDAYPDNYTLHSRSTTLETAPQVQNDYSLTPEAQPQFQDEHLAATGIDFQHHSRSTTLETAPEFQEDYAYPQQRRPEYHSRSNALETAPHYPRDNLPTRCSEDTRSEISYYHDDGVSSISGVAPSVADDYSVSDMSHDDSRSEVFSLKKEGSDTETIREAEPQAELELRLSDEAFRQTRASLHGSDFDHRMSIESSEASIISAADLSFRPWSNPELKPTISRSSIVGRFSGPQERAVSMDSVAPPPILLNRNERPTTRSGRFGGQVNFSLLKRATLKRQANSVPERRQAELELLTQSIPYEKARKGETPFTNYQVASVYPQKKPWALSAGSQKKVKKVPIGLDLIQEHDIAQAASKLSGARFSPVQEEVIQERQPSPGLIFDRMPVLVEE